MLFQEVPCSRRNYKYKNEEASRYSICIYILFKIEKEYEIIFSLEISSLYNESNYWHWKVVGIGLRQVLARILLLSWRCRRDVITLEPNKPLQLYADEKFKDESI